MDYFSSSSLTSRGRILTMVAILTVEPTGLFDYPSIEMYIIIS